jgi:predicted nucleotidyltransferase
MTDRIRLILSELRARLEELYGERLDRLILYGSQARGDAEPDSDIDVLVVLRGEVNRWVEKRRISILRAEISLRHDTVISIMFVSSEDFEHKEQPLLANVRREGAKI